MEPHFNEKSVTIGILGGTGLMGQWFRRFFESAGHGVLICGRKTELTEDELVRGSQVVIISQPLSAALETARRVGPLMGETQALMDICSLKSEIASAMLESTGAEVVAAHPLFGPSTESLKGQNVVLCPMRGSVWAAWLGAELSKGGAKVTQSDPVTHDRMTAVVQGLTHFITIALGRTLADLGLAPETLLPFATPIFRAKLALVGRLFAQDLSLYAALVGKNPEAAWVIEAFMKACQEAKGSISPGASPETGMGYLENIRDFLGDYSARGLKESDFFLAALAGYGRKTE